MSYTTEIRGYDSQTGRKEENTVRKHNHKCIRTHSEDMRHVQNKDADRIKVKI